MGNRGPKPGWKKAAAAKAAAAPSTPAKKRPAATPAKAAPARKVTKRVEQVTKHLADVIALPVAHRENPEKLGGDALRALAHKRGLAKSDIEKMTDEKIREQLKYLAFRQYHDEAA